MFRPSNNVHSGRGVWRRVCVMTIPVGFEEVWWRILDGLVAWGGVCDSGLR